MCPVYFPFLFTYSTTLSLAVRSTFFSTFVATVFCPVDSNLATVVFSNWVSVYRTHFCSFLSTDVRSIYPAILGSNICSLFPAISGPLHAAHGISNFDS